MKFNPIIYIFVNYIVAMFITIYSIVRKIRFFEYIETLLFVIICVNIIYFSIYFIIKSITVKDNCTFELEVDSSEEDIKNLLKEAQENSTLENNDNLE